MKPSIDRVRLSRWLLTAALVASGSAIAGGQPAMTVYKSPACGCCGKWIDHLRQAGFTVEAVDTNDLGRIKAMSGIAPEQASCHTARIGDYVIEGHVPAADIRRLIAEHPDARGLTAPGMPQGSPGMEGPHPEHYQVLLIGRSGKTTLFAQH